MRRRDSLSQSAGIITGCFSCMLCYFNLMSNEPENLVLEMLRGIRAEFAVLRAEFANTKTELKSDIHSLRADVASDLVLMQAKNVEEHRKTRADTRDQITGLRRAVNDYHLAVVGHGILISELEDRMRRVERHLDLPSLDSH